MTFPDPGLTLPRMLKAGQILPPQFATQERRTAVVPMPMPDHLQGVCKTVSMLERLTRLSMALNSPWGKCLCPTGLVVGTDGSTTSTNTRSVNIKTIPPSQRIAHQPLPHIGPIERNQIFDCMRATKLRRTASRRADQRARLNVLQFS
jgi:hypothetical protein